MSLDFLDDFMDESVEEKATLEYINELGDEAATLNSEMQELQSQIDVMNVRFRHLTERELPRCFLDLGMKSYTMADGTTYQLKETISGSLERAPDKQFAIDWCEKQGWDELFKVDVGVTFDRGSRQEALEVREQLEKQGMSVSLKEGIHAQTFAKHLRELHAENNERANNGELVDPIPFAELGAYHGVKAEIKKSKKK